MTVGELFRRSLARHKVLIYTTFTSGSLRRWLDQRVTAGWLTLRDGRYFLTAEGLEVARALADLRLSADTPVSA